MRLIVQLLNPTFPFLPAKAIAKRFSASRSAKGAYHTSPAQRAGHLDHRWQALKARSTGLEIEAGCQRIWGLFRAVGACGSLRALACGVVRYVFSLSRPWSSRFSVSSQIVRRRNKLKLELQRSSGHPLNRYVARRSPNLLWAGPLARIALHRW